MDRETWVRRYLGASVKIRPHRAERSRAVPPSLGERRGNHAARTRPERGSSYRSTFPVKT
jgi:hypothetical protein